MTCVLGTVLTYIYLKMSQDQRNWDANDIEELFVNRHNPKTMSYYLWHILRYTVASYSGINCVYAPTLSVTTHDQDITTAVYSAQYRRHRSKGGTTIIMGSFSKRSEIGAKHVRHVRYKSYDIQIDNPNAGKTTQKPYAWNPKQFYTFTEPPTIPKKRYLNTYFIKDAGKAKRFSKPRKQSVTT